MHLLKLSLTKLAKLSLLSVALLLIHLSSQIHGYENGAPERVCDKMKPGHGEQSMAGKLPFKITLDKWFIQGTGKINIKVTSSDPSRYKLAGALFVMKRPRSQSRAFGSFDPKRSAEDLKTIDCFGKVGSRSGITHSHNRPKTSLEFDWFAPNDTSAEYELHATLVRDFNSFWADYIHPQRINISIHAPASTGRRTTPNHLIFMAAVAMIVLFHCGHYYT